MASCAVLLAARRTFLLTAASYTLAWTTACRILESNCLSSNRYIQPLCKTLFRANHQVFFRSPTTAINQTGVSDLVYLLPGMIDLSRRFIPSSYRPSFASLVQVAWQAYMSSVSYDNPHHHANPSTAKATIKAGNSDGVLVRGGGGGVGGTDGVAANGTGEDGVRTGGGEGMIPSPGLPVAVAAINGGTARRTVMVDRRSTGRYAYTSTSSRTGAACDGGAGCSSRAVEDDGSVSGGGSGGGVRIVGVSRTPSTPSSPLISKATEL